MRIPWVGGFGGYYAQSFDSLWLYNPFAFWNTPFFVIFIHFDTCSPYFLSASICIWLIVAVLNNQRQNAGLSSTQDFCLFFVPFSSIFFSNIVFLYLFFFICLDFWIKPFPLYFWDIFF